MLLLHGVADNVAVFFYGITADVACVDAVETVGNNNNAVDSYQYVTITNLMFCHVDVYVVEYGVTFIIMWLKLHSDFSRLVHGDAVIAMVI